MSNPIKEIIYKIFITLFYLFIFSPVILLVIFSFNADNFPTLPWKGFTLDWYTGLFSNASMIEPLLNSLVVAFSVGILALVIGFFGANYFYKSKAKSKKQKMTLRILDPRCQLNHQRSNKCFGTWSQNSFKPIKIQFLGDTIQRDKCHKVQEANQNSQEVPK